MARARLADWAQAAYAAPGVADLCLALQDEHGQSVCLLLWAAWAGATDRPVDQLGAASLARTWEANVVGPLRAARTPETTRVGVRAGVCARACACVCVCA